MRIRVLEGFLRYPPGQEVHTAASGRIDALHEIFMEIEDRETGVTAQGEVRANIDFITGTPEHEVVPKAISLLERLPLDGPDRFAETFNAMRHEVPKISQALVENTLVDLQARQRGVAAAELLGGRWADGVPCNECVFWGSDEDMAANVAGYRSLGFSKIKVRVGIGSAEDDLRRLEWLRGRFGSELELAIDANGAWDSETAMRRIEQLARFDLQYVEQPTAKGDWEALERVASESGLEVMIDEGLQTSEDVERVCSNRGRISAHLKIAKAGGIAAVVAIGRRFDASGVSYVVGQMNEGGLATAAAVHAAMALSPRLGELYGALGLLNDPGAGVEYRDGKVRVPPGCGVGISIRPETLTVLWDSDAA